MSLKYSSLLNSYVDWSPIEIQNGKKYLDWEELTINWEKIDLLWEEIFILLEVEKVIKRGGSSPGYQEYVDSNPWKKLNEELGKEKTKKVIKLYCRVNNLVYDESREVEDNSMKISVNEFERFVKDAISVKILT